MGSREGVNREGESPGVKASPLGHIPSLLSRGGVKLLLSFKNQETKKLYFSLRLISSVRGYPELLAGLQQRKVLEQS